MTKTKSKIFVLLVAIMLALLLFAPFSTLQSYAFEAGQEATVIASKSNLFTTADFGSEKVTTLDADEQVVIVSVRHNDKVIVMEEDGDFVKIKTNKDIEGYIYKYYITQNASQQVYPFFNASIRSNTVIYDVEKIPTSYTAEQGQRVYIYQGFDDKEEFTAIQIALEDGSLYNGYVLTADVKPDGVNSALVVAITIIVAIVTIVLAIVFLKKKRKKKKSKE